MPLQPSLVEQWLFLRGQHAPGPLLDMMAALGFKAVQTALELDLFEALDREAPRAAEALAEELGLDPVALAALLEALEPLGYVERRGGGWHNAPMTERWLLARSETPLGELFHYFDDMLQRWRDLGPTLRAGRATERTRSWLRDDPRRAALHHRAMRATARLLLPELLRRVTLPAGARTLLDLGGSHGLYAAAFCRRYPELSAVVLDRPEAEAVARQTIADEGLGERVRFRVGDMTEDPLPGPGDVVLLFNVLRVLPAEGVQRLLARVRQVLSPEGTLVVLDQLVPNPSSRLSRANTKLLNLELSSFAPGAVHTGQQVCAWAGDAGFTRCRSFALRRAAGQGVVIAHP